MRLPLLAQTLEEEKSWRAIVEDVGTLQESPNQDISTLIKECDHAPAMVKVLKKRRLNFTLIMRGYLT
jgi:hypothetical protein